jgi:hypothetical protein
MKRIALFAVVLALASCAHIPPAGAGPLRISFTMPQQENAGTCVVPVLVAAVGDATWRGVYSWSGPVSGTDSTYALPGVSVLRLLYVPSGVYTVRVHGTRSVNAWLCDTTATVTVVNVPGVPVLN